MSKVGEVEEVSTSAIGLFAFFAFFDSEETLARLAPPC
jgi:hypothetical protein